MKKIVSLVLILAICLSLCACGKSDICTCDCTQCADCEKKKLSQEPTVDSDSVVMQEENSKKKVELPEPILLAEDQNIRVELVGFFEEDSPYKHLGRFVTMRYTNKADYEIGVRLENLAIEGSAIDCAFYSSSPDLLPGETTSYHCEILDSFHNALDSIDQFYTLKGRFKVMRRTGESHYADAYELPFSVENALNGANNTGASISDNSDSWKQFRDYLIERGPVTVITDNTEDIKNQVTIEVNTGIIKISYQGVSTRFYGNSAAQARSSMWFELPSNAETVDVHMEYIVAGADTSGGAEIQSSRPTYNWEIRNYRSGDDLSFTADYTHEDGNGNSIKKSGTVMTISPTKAFILITDALDQTLTESGLDVTMADLGFSNY